MGELFLLDFQLAQIGKDGHALGEHRAPGKRQAVLRQISEGDALLHGDGAGIEAFNAGQHLEQRRFPGAVGAHQSGPLVGRDQPIDIFEENLGAVALSRPVELHHVGLSFILAAACAEFGLLYRDSELPKSFPQFLGGPGKWPGVRPGQAGGACPMEDHYPIRMWACCMQLSLANGTRPKTGSTWHEPLGLPAHFTRCGSLKPQGADMSPGRNVGE